MPKYRRDFLPGGTFFSTVALLERKRDLLVSEIDLLRDSVRRVRCVRVRRVGGVAGSSALHLDVAGGRCGFRDPLASVVGAVAGGCASGGSAYDCEFVWLAQS